MSVYEEDEHPFYDVNIFRTTEKNYVASLLRKYKNEPVNDELKAKIWGELQMEKYKGKIKIPFKVVMRLDPSGKFPDYIEVILDTKV